jgi:hypothetical protein
VFWMFAEQCSTGKASADVYRAAACSCTIVHNTLQPSQQLTSRHQPGHFLPNILTATYVCDAAEAYRQAQPAS